MSSCYIFMDTFLKRQDLDRSYLQIRDIFYMLLNAFIFFPFPSRLCTAGIPWCPEALANGGHEDPGHTTGWQSHCSGCVPSQDGDSHRGGSTAGGTATQAEAQRHEHSDAVWLLRGHMMLRLNRSERRSLLHSNVNVSLFIDNRDPHTPLGWLPAEVPVCLITLFCFFSAHRDIRNDGCRPQDVRELLLLK